MPKQQPFNDFLNSPGPSTPRGRGRGRGGGGGGSGRGGGGYRGGRGGGGAGGGRSSFATDYSNVPLDYANMNNRGYKKSEGTSIFHLGCEASTGDDADDRLRSCAFWTRVSHASDARKPIYTSRAGRGRRRQRKRWRTWWTWERRKSDSGVQDASNGAGVSWAGT